MYGDMNTLHTVGENMKAFGKVDVPDSKALDPIIHLNYSTLKK